MRTKREKWSLAAGAAMLTAVICGELFAHSVPDEFQVTEGQALSFAGLPLSAEPEGTVKAARDLSAGASYTADLRLFGVIEVKKVRVAVTAVQEVVPDGEPFGIKLYTEGVMVTAVTDVETSSGSKTPAADAGVKKGDILIAVNGQTVNSNAEIAACVEQSNGAVCTLNVKRDGTTFEVKLRPQRSAADGLYKAGLWVRDSTAGIGTITYYDPATQVYAGLGHAVCDVDTGKVLPLLQGEAVYSTVTGVERGTKGHIGELVGTLLENRLGTLLINGSTGVYGVLSGRHSGKAYPVAARQQVHTGAAKMLTTVDGTGPHAYDVRIEQVRYASGSGEPDMVVRITDKKLLARTGGIVQGMSGSPLLQDGRFIGAVTHVFIDDPQRGYGIFAEKMSITSKTLAGAYLKGVS